ncbi:MAG: succinate--CoA ligase subunit beta [Euryarchaeota archaeon]|nr:succinate--CoA ligase subunit beta [Euryarchaeota archaeon]
MNLLEHEAKDLLQRYGLDVPRGNVFNDRSSLARSLGDWSFPLMVKGQVPIGGRGKAGAIRKALSPEEALDAFDSIAGMNVKGHIVRSVLIEEFVGYDMEFYLAMTIDRSLGRPVLVISRKGGMEVESTDAKDIKKIPLDPFDGMTSHDLEEAIESLGVEGRVASGIKETSKRIWNVFSRSDCELVEINPLIINDGGQVCLDAKVIINDDSLFRHPELDLDVDREREPFEAECRRNGFSGVVLGEGVAVVANGAGLTMSVLDEIGDAGLRGGAFLDLGGADDPDRIVKAITTVGDRTLLPKIEGLFICIFGGITRCDVVAEGIVAALSVKMFDVPIVIRLRGINESEGRMILENAGLIVHSSIEEACAALRIAVGSRS